jgi:hypothetical protein
MADRGDAVAELEEACGDRPTARLLPYLLLFEPEARNRVVDRFKKGRKFTTIEAQALEGLLHGSDQGLRDGILRVLEVQGDRGLSASLSRLLGAALHARRLAGLQLARQLLTKRRLVRQCRAALEAYRHSRRHRRGDEERLLGELLRKVRQITSSKRR